MRISIAFLASLLLLAGCATKDPSPKESNTVSVRGMHLSLKAADTLPYVDKASADHYERYKNIPSSGYLNLQRYYIFSENGQSPDYLLILRHTEITSGVFTGVTYDYDDALSFGAQRLGERTYETVTRVGGLPYAVQRLMSDSGRIPKNRYIVKRMGRLGPGDKHIFEIIYYESLDVSNTKPKDWENPSALSEAQQLYLNEFEQRAMQSFILVE